MRAVAFIFLVTAALLGTAFETLNYLVWRQGHDVENQRLCTEDFGNVRAYDYRVHVGPDDAGVTQVGKVFVRPAALTAGDAGYVLSDAEIRTLVNDEPVGTAFYGTTTSMVFTYDQTYDARLLEIEVYPFAVRKSVLRGVDVAGYLTGGRIVLRGHTINESWPVCPGDAVSTLYKDSKADVAPAFIYLKTLASACAKGTRTPLDAAPGLAANILKALKREKTVSLDVYGRDGALVVAATLPMTDLAKAEARMIAVAERQKRGGYGESFSPFVRHF